MRHKADKEINYRNAAVVEKGHLKDCRSMDIKVSSLIVYGECGRYSLYVCINTRCIGYWLRITQLPSSHLSRKALVMLEKLLQNNKTAQLNHMMITLFKFGFGIVWENQGVENVKLFLR